MSSIFDRFATWADSCANGLLLVTVNVFSATEATDLSCSMVHGVCGITIPAKSGHSPPANIPTSIFSSTPLSHDSIIMLSI